MPEKIDKINLPPELDRRIKLLAEDKERIKELFAQGEGIRPLARLFKVSRRTIQFVVFPDRLANCKAAYKKRGGWKKYAVSNQERADIMREHRNYKKKVLVTI